MSDVKAMIVVVGGQVLVESDAPSEARVKAARAGSCEATAAKVVGDLPTVKKVIADDEKELAGRTDGRSVGSLGPIPDEGGGFSAAIGVHSPERFEAQIWYGVDAAGRLSVTYYGEDVAVPAAALAEVERACRSKP